MRSFFQKATVPPYPAIRSCLATLRAEFTFVFGTAGAGPFFGGFGFAALGAEFAGVSFAAGAGPLGGFGGFRFTALRAEFAGVGFAAGAFP